MRVRYPTVVTVFEDQHPNSYKGAHAPLAAHRLNRTCPHRPHPVVSVSSSCLMHDTSGGAPTSWSLGVWRPPPRIWLFEGFLSTCSVLYCTLGSRGRGCESLPSRFFCPPPSLPKMGISSNIRQAAHWPLTKAAGFEIFFMLHRYSVTLGSQVLVFIVGFLAGHGAEVGEYCVPGLCSPTLKVKSPTDMKNKLDRQVAVVGANLAFHVPLGAVSSCLTDTDVGVLQACSRAKTSSTVVCVTMEALPQLLAHTPGALKSAFSLGGRTVNSFTSIADLEAVWEWLEAGPGRGPRPMIALRTADEMV